MQVPAPENACAAANRGFIGHEVDEGLQFLRHGGHQADRSGLDRGIGER